ncbi:MAG: site-specific integrase [Sphingobium sp.]
MLGKQAKVLSPTQIKTVIRYLECSRWPERNIVIFLLSVRAGLRAKEIASITWDMVTDAGGDLRDCICLTDSATKGSSGGVIPMSSELGNALRALQISSNPSSLSDRIIRTTRSRHTSAQVIINMFRQWYSSLGLLGCSSHSGRRTFITRAAKNIGRFGGSLRDVQALARHRSLAMTQRYIEIDTEAMRKVVDA